jgi:NAD(P)-dependent dehydrogenase (short-subunit alcohol dehydrogenase family)
MEKTHQRAMVTAASGGIGCAVARRLAHDSFMVVMPYAGHAARVHGCHGPGVATGDRLAPYAFNRTSS